ncbi:MAG: hypothetical protein ACPLZY_04460 [Candidatus Norongarragalinales archaeon]
MASVTADRVRVRLGLTASDIADGEVATFISEAAAYLANQTGLTLDPSNCTEDQAKAIADLAAIYAYLRVTGVQPSGWTANIGELVFSGSPQKIAQLEFLRSQVLDWISRNRRARVAIA